MLLAAALKLVSITPFVPNRARRVAAWPKVVLFGGLPSPDFAGQQKTDWIMTKPAKCSSFLNLNLAS